MIASSHSVSESLEAPQVSGAEAPWVASEPSASEVVVRGKRILLVEDQELVRAALRMMLELDGHRVTEASNGAEALSLFAVGQFDLIVTDFEMPLIKGNELAISIKLLAPSQRILMITASDKAHGNVENPVDGLLNKPLTVPDLRGALGKLLAA